MTETSLYKGILFSFIITSFQLHIKDFGHTIDSTEIQATLLVYWFAFGKQDYQIHLYTSKNTALTEWNLISWVFGVNIQISVWYIRCNKDAALHMIYKGI